MDGDTGNNDTTTGGTTVPQSIEAAPEVNVEGNGNQTSQRANLQTAEPPGWVKGVKEEYREKVAAHKTVTDLVKDYLDVKGRLDGAITLPGENATSEERAAFLERLGVPKTKEDYQFTKPESLPEGLEYNEKFDAWFRDKAHALNLSKAQAEGLYNDYNRMMTDRQAETLAERAVKRKETEAVLMREMGEKYGETMQLARRAVRVFGSDEFDGFLSETGLADDARMVKFFAGLGRSIGGDALSPSGYGVSLRTADPNDPNSWDFSNSFPER